MDKHNILFVHHGVGIGGASVSLNSILAKLDQNIYNSAVLCIHDGKHIKLFKKNCSKVYLDKRIKDLPYTTGGMISLNNPFSFFKIFYYLRSILLLKSWFTRIDPEIVHLNSSCLSAAAIAAKKLDIKVVWHIREYILDGYCKIARNFHSWIGRNYVDAIIAITKFDGEKVGCHEKTTVIYNYVDFNEYDKELHKNRERVNSEYNVCLLGGISKIKGTLEFVKSFGLVNTHVKRMKYYIVGHDGKGVTITTKNKIKSFVLQIFRIKTYSQKIHEVIKKYPEGSITLTGVKDDVPEFLSKMDLLVFPSTVPHFGRPIIEAWAMGLPVIASDFGENEEIIEDGVDGILVSPNDVDALSKAIIKIGVDRNFAFRMGEAGRKKVKESFNEAKNYKKIEKIYDNLYQ